MNKSKNASIVMLQGLPTLTLELFETEKNDFLNFY
jgi:hypothetical protein